VPVFAGPGPLPGDQPSASRFLGSVAITLRLADLMAQLEREGRLQGLHVAMSDLGSSLPDQRGGKAVPLASTMPAGSPVQVSYARDLAVYSRLWRIDFHPVSSFLSQSEGKLPLLLGAAGSVIALLLGALAMMLVRARQSAVARADASGAALKDSEGRWKFAIEGAGDALWDRDLAAGTVFFSPRWKEMLGFAGEEVGDQLDEWTRRVHPEDLPPALAALQAHLDGVTPSYASEHRVACKNGSWKWVLDRGQVMQRDASGAPLRMIGTCSDITQRKQTAQVLQASLRDKDALLKEVHHRVKNNLQVIISLLRLEGRRAKAPTTRATLAEMQGRIGSMAMLHESLYRSGTFASVDLADYLGKVVADAFGAQVSAPTSVVLRTNLVAVEVTMDQALPCGLLLNELVSNCLKHAFTDDRPGELDVDLQPTQLAGVWQLRVSDNGVGLPAGFSVGEQASMGLRLVGQLCQQLGAALELQSTPGGGASFTVRFALDPLTPLVMPQ
jgi:PAS domain S-box-containing protein